MVDVDGNGAVAPTDAVIVINGMINGGQSAPLSGGISQGSPPRRVSGFEVAADIGAPLTHEDELVERDEVQPARRSDTLFNAPDEPRSRAIRRLAHTHVDALFAEEAGDIG